MVDVDRKGNVYRRDVEDGERAASARTTRRILPHVNASIEVTAVVCIINKYSHRLCSHHNPQSCVK